MTCAWEEFLKLLPGSLRQEADSWGREELQELRLRLGQKPEYIFPGRGRWGRETVTRQTLDFCVNAASRYSPWAASTAARGYITAPGGHRIGLCGEAVWDRGQVAGIREPTSLCLRVARDFPGIGRDGAALGTSLLLLGAPGWGKTTLLRDICRQIGEKETVCVVDSRGEVFPKGIPRGRRMDVLSACPKGTGVEMVLRTMTPQWIALDEITAAEDTRALLFAANCGVKLLATAHAASPQELSSREIYRPLVEQGIFEHLLVLRPDKSYRLERMGAWGIK